MLKQIYTLFVFLIAVLALSSCGGSGDKTNQEGQTETVQEQPTTQFPAGEAIFKEKCIVCHMADGKGQPGIFPPLAGSDYLLSDKRRAVHQVLNGSAEKMIVNGQEYSTPMPAQVDNHQDAVDVINYVLNAWGNDGGTITLEEVGDIEIGQ